jgi:general secretion pathway protein G
MKRVLRTRAGFSLVELVIVMSLLALLAGAALPVAGRFLDSRARQATAAALERLTAAAALHFEDTAQLPTTIGQLLADAGTAGWSGPYLLGGGEQVFGAGGGPTVDAWGRAYRVQRSGNTWTATSSGADGTAGNADDLARTVDVTQVRRRWTVERLAVINRAIGHWNDLYLASDPLPPAYGTIYAELVGAGLLPADADFQVDGFGQAYVADPPVTPVVRVTSTALQ